MPTAVEIPAPSGPVVISTPAVWPYSGWPGVNEFQVRNACKSLISKPYPLKNNWVYRVKEECPQESTKRSLPIHFGSFGS